MARNPQFDYSKRNFSDIRQELVNFVQQNYPDVITDFSDESVGMVLLELCAGVGDILSNNTDRVFQETQLPNAQLFSSILNIAKNLGFKIDNRKASVSIADFTVLAPVRGDSVDVEYLPLIRAGAQVNGGGTIFETIDDIDFASPFNSKGIPNRILIPRFDSNDTIIAYEVTKREVITSGESRIERRFIQAQDAVPFYEITLPETDIIGIESVIIKTGNINTVPTTLEFLDDEIRWYEVDYLAQKEVIITDNTIEPINGLRTSKTIRTNRKFIKEFDAANRCTLIFGAGTSNDVIADSFDRNNLSALKNIFLDNNALGLIPPANSTIFIRYRIGGGLASNVNANTITNVTTADIVLLGRDEVKNNNVRRSLAVNNPTPALGGGDRLSVEQIRKLISYNFAAQDRAVTLNDYVSEIYKMPPQFGVPFKANALKQNNKIVISILGLNSQGKLDNTNTSVLRENLSRYLATKRMINDYVEIRSAAIFNISVEVDVLIDDRLSSTNQFALEIIQQIRNFFDVNQRQMGEDYFIGELIRDINDVVGVLSLLNIRIFNNIGGVEQYSLNESPMNTLTNTSVRRELDIQSQTLFNQQDGMYEIKFPEKDIKVNLLRRRDLQTNG